MIGVSSCGVKCSFLMLLCLTANSVLWGDEPKRRSSTIQGGQALKLVSRWPEIKQAPRDCLATVELWIKPDTAAVNRERSFLFNLCNAGGSDLVSVGLALHRGVLQAHVFGISLVGTKLAAGKWTHVAFVVDTSTLNKQARLYVDGKLAADELILQPWPSSFAVAEFFGDRWLNKRIFSGSRGDIRFSNSVRYSKAFSPPAVLAQDKRTRVLIRGDQLAK